MCSENSRNDTYTWCRVTFVSPTVCMQVLTTQQLEQMKQEWLEKVEQHLRKVCTPYGLCKLQECNSGTCA